MEINLRPMLDGVTSERRTLQTLAKDVELAVEVMASCGGVGEIGLAASAALQHAAATYGHLDAPALRLAWPSPAVEATHAGE